MLSILIPTYNYVCTDLVCDLQKQAARLGVPYEILVADDGSAETCKAANRAINSVSFSKYVELPENVGRTPYLACEMQLRIIHSLIVFYYLLIR